MLLHPAHTELSSDSPPFTGGLADCLQALAHLAGDGCLLEDPSGRLVGQRLLTAAPPLVEAVLAGHLRPLHDALTSRRKAGLLCGAVVVQGLVGQLRMAHLALSNHAGPLCGLWLALGHDRDLDLDSLAPAIESLQSLLTGTAAAAAPAVLDGAPLPPEFAAGRLWVCRFGSQAPPALLHLALGRRRSGAVRVLGVLRQDAVYAVLAAPPGADEADLFAVVEHLRAATQDQVQAPVAAAVSLGCDRTGLAEARAQADTVLTVTAPQQMRTVPDARWDVTARRLRRAVADLPHLGPDPLQTLAGHDARRGTELLTTLRAWLQECCDTAATASELAIHANTLRYRLQCIEDRTGLDLRHDFGVRAELYLRLTAAP